MTPVENGLLLALVPMETEVVVAVDLHLLALDVLESVLLHAVAHLALGHVVPGDRWERGDTAETATKLETASLQWDRDAEGTMSRLTWRDRPRGASSRLKTVHRTKKRNSVSGA